jgi:hypothetical protein
MGGVGSGRPPGPTQSTLDTWRLYADGVRPSHIAKRLGIPVRTVESRLRRYRSFGDPESGPGDLGRVDASGERCRCGLRLPCEDCLPTTAVEFVARRMWHGEKR